MSAPRVHAPSRRLPCGYKVHLPDVGVGDRLVRICRHRTVWEGHVHASTVVDGLLLVDWQLLEHRGAVTS